MVGKYNSHLIHPFTHVLFLEAWHRQDLELHWPPEVSHFSGIGVLHLHIRCVSSQWSVALPLSPSSSEARKTTSFSGITGTRKDWLCRKLCQCAVSLVHSLKDPQSRKMVPKDHIFCGDSTTLQQMSSLMRIFSDL